MAKANRKARVELDQALDRLGGGVVPIARHTRSPRPAKRQKVTKRKAKRMTRRKTQRKKR